MNKPKLKTVFFGKTKHFVPNNLNVWYVFGALLLGALAMQYLSGLWLAFYYAPSPDKAFASIQYIMHQVHYGWLIRTIHTTCASAIFILLYLHLLRGLLYRSYRSPRQLVWYFGVLLFWLLMLESFFGILLPWGQTSYWGATVVSNVVTALPHGASLLTLLRGDYQISGVTLTRFYALHIVALPILLIFLIQWHIRALHQVGSGNPGLSPIETRSLDGSCPKQCIPFFPEQALKDLLALIIFFILFAAVLFFKPDGFGFLKDKLNNIPANPMQTPETIRPLWYLASFYSILRAIPNKLYGVLLLSTSVLMWLLLPLLDRLSKHKTQKLHQILVWSWFVCWLTLTYLGLQPITSGWVCALGGIIGLYFFLFILTGLL